MFNNQYDYQNDEMVTIKVSIIYDRVIEDNASGYRNDPPRPSQTVYQLKKRLKNPYEEGAFNQACTIMDNECSM
jgi:hypothetical protein